MCAPYDPLVKSLSFRTATVSDIPAVVALVTSAYRGEASKEGWTTEANLIDGQRLDADMLRPEIERPDSILILGMRDDELVACSHVALVRPGTANFGLFAVSPRLQGRGTGKQILAEAERVARREWDVTELELTVIDIRDELIAYYERRGFVRTGEHKALSYGDERFGTPRVPDLRMESMRKPLTRSRQSRATEPALTQSLAM